MSKKKPLEEFIKGLQIGLFVLLILIIGSNSMLLIAKIQDSAYKKASCEGIDYFFSNISFYYDTNIMNRYYRNCYNSTETFVEDYFRILPPRVLYQCKVKGYDCEDYAFAIMCIAEKYNITCEPTMESRLSRIYGTRYHAGVECKINGEWETIT